MSSKNTDSSQHEDWWILFPIAGLEVTDHEPRLEQPIWGDATFLSLAHLPLVVERLQLNEHMKPGHDHEGDILFMLGVVGDRPLKSRWKNEGDQPSGYLAIHRRLERSSDGPDSIPRSATDRATSLEAGLALGMLSAWDVALRTCGFVRDRPGPILPRAALDLGVGRCVIEISASLSLFSFTDPSFSLDYESLANRLTTGVAPVTVRLLLSQPRTDDVPLIRDLRRACGRLVSACFSHSAENQILGEVTSLEMLLSPDGDFGRLESRCRVLASGIKGSTGLLSALMKARHEYVHQGREVERMLALQLLPVLTGMIERIARSIGVFRNKNQLCAFLDAKVALSALADGCPDAAELLRVACSTPWENDGSIEATG